MNPQPLPDSHGVMQARAAPSLTTSLITREPRSSRALQRPEDRGRRRRARHRATRPPPLGHEGGGTAGPTPRDAPVTSGTRLSSLPARFLLRGDHLLLDPNPSRDCPLILERHRRRVLQRDAGGVEHCNLSVGRAARHVAGYHLPDLAAFPGTYVEGRYGFAFGKSSGGDLWLKNHNGVVMHLVAKREGLMLSLGGDAVEIKMKQNP